MKYDICDKLEGESRVTVNLRCTWKLNAFEYVNKVAKAENTVL